MYIKKISIAMAVVMLAGCGMTDDLAPSGEDKRGASATLAPGDIAPAFSMPDIWGATHTLTSQMEGRKGVVLYFAMWCPICDSHMQSILQGHMPKHPDVSFIVVDYVSGTVAGSKRSAMEGAWAQSAFTILVDERQDTLDDYGATMGTTVVVDSGGIIRMIEDYKDGKLLEDTLNGL